MEAQALGVDDLGAAQRPDRPTVLYDDGCRFCRAMAEMVSRIARRGEIGFLPWSSGIAEDWLVGLAPGVRDASMHLKLPDGALVSGGRAWSTTLANVRGLKWLAWLAEHSLVAGRLFTWGCEFVAGHREFLSRLVPDRPAVIQEPEMRESRLDQP